MPEFQRGVGVHDFSGSLFFRLVQLVCSLCSLCNLCSLCSLLGDGQYCTVASSSNTATTISGSESWWSDRSTIYALYAVTFTSTAIIATMMLEADVSMGVAAPADDLGILGEILDPEE